MSDPINLTAEQTTPSSLTDQTAMESDDLAAAKRMAIDAAIAADDRKANDIRILQLSDVSYIADFFVIATGFSSAQVRAVARNIEVALEEKWHRQPLRTEGQAEGSWILQDYGEIIVHIFMPDERDFYNLEAFWGHATEVDFDLTAAAVANQQ
ncbi:MAG: ribosome silencing factor [Cyanobacteria bacterium P01_A01_bin.123]